MSANLTLFPPIGVARSYLLKEGRNHFAGRDPGSDVYLQDPRVSARHALFQWTGSAGGWTCWQRWRDALLFRLDGFVLS